VTLSEFKDSAKGAAPPAGLPPGLLALWHDAHGDWGRAHEVAQEMDGADGARIHAYLHRKEGDISNAGYWYRRAGLPAATGSLEAEWTVIVTAILER
jgi:hypothetical protein